MSINVSPLEILQVEDYSDTAIYDRCSESENELTDETDVGCFFLKNSYYTREVLLAVDFLSGCAASKSPSQRQTSWNGGDKFCSQ